MSWSFDPILIRKTFRFYFDNNFSPDSVLMKLNDVITRKPWKLFLTDNIIPSTELFDVTACATLSVVFMTSCFKYIIQICTGTRYITNYSYGSDLTCL